MMIKRMLWYAGLVLVLCCAIALVVNATSIRKPKRAVPSRVKVNPAGGAYQQSNRTNFGLFASGVHHASKAPLSKKALIELKAHHKAGSEGEAAAGPQPVTVAVSKPQSVPKATPVQELRQVSPKTPVPVTPGLDATSRTNPGSSLSGPGTPPARSPGQARVEAAVAAHERWLRTRVVSPGDKPLLKQFFPPDRPRETNPLDNHDGPDGFGYNSADNIAPDTAAYAWIDIRGVGSRVFTSEADDEVASEAIGFNFNFYGSAFTSCWVCSNGNLQFADDGDPDYQNVCLPHEFGNNTSMAVCPFWTDLVCSGGTGRGNCWYRSVANQYFIVEWDSVATYDGSAYNKFEVILYPNGNIKVQIAYTDDASGCTIGIQGASSGENYLSYRCLGSGIDLGTGAVQRAVWYYNAPPPAHNFACRTVISPIGHYAPGATSVPVTAVFMNRGATTESSPVKYRFNGGSVQTGATGTLVMFGSDTITFAATLTVPGVEGSYPLLVWSDLPNDSTRLDDTVRTTVEVARGEDCANPRSITALPYLESGQTTCDWLNNYAGTCNWYDEGPDIVYQIELPTDTILTISLLASGVTEPGYAMAGVLLSATCPTTNNCVASASIYGDGTATIPCTPVAAGTYWIVVDGGTTSGSCFNYDLAVRACAPCPTVCPPGAVTESESNDACEAANPLAVGTTVCGTVTANTSTRDVDWYQVTLTTSDTIVWTVTPSNFIANLAIYSGSCGSPSQIGWATSVAMCSTATARSGCLPPGDYWVTVAPNYENLTSPQGYTGQVSIVTCALPMGRCCYGDFVNYSCEDTTASRCAQMTGRWTFGVSCATSPCPPCPIDTTLNLSAARTWNSTTCNGDTACHLQAGGWTVNGHSRHVAVVIPTAGLYTFSLLQLESGVVFLVGSVHELLWRYGDFL